MSTDSKPIVYLLGTGGTIATQGANRMDGTEYGTAGIRAPIQEMLDRIPEAADFARVKAEQFINVPSTGIELDHWLGLAKRINRIFSEEPEVAGVAVTHGTATLEETAYFLNLTVKSRKPVVVTGAMRPPTAMGTDSDVNLLNAIQIAASPESIGRGVVTVLNNEIQAARHVTKTNTYRVETFKSGEFGFLGYADSDHRVVYYQSPTRKHTHESEFSVDGLTELPRVEVAYATAGGDGLPVRLFAEAGVSGIVSAALAPGASHPDQTDALETVVKAGTPVVIAAHVGSGRVILTEGNREKGFIAGDNLSPKKARILLMLALTVTKDRDEIQRMFDTY